MLTAWWAARRPASNSTSDRTRRTAAAGDRARRVSGGYAILGLSGSDSSYWTGLLPGLIVVGIGTTVSVTPLTATVFDSAPSDRSGAASGINNAIDVSAGLVAVAVLGLAFGDTGADGIDSAALASGYRDVMFAAAALVGLSAVTALVTVRGPTRPQ